MLTARYITSNTQQMNCFVRYLICSDALSSSGDVLSLGVTGLLCTLLPAVLVCLIGKARFYEGRIRFIGTNQKHKTVRYNSMLHKYIMNT